MIEQTRARKYARTCRVSPSQPRFFKRFFGKKEKNMDLKRGLRVANDFEPLEKKKKYGSEKGSEGCQRFGTRPAI